MGSHGVKRLGRWELDPAAPGRQMGCGYTGLASALCSVLGCQLSTSCLSPRPQGITKLT